MYVCVQFFIFEFHDWLFYSVNHMLEVGKTLLLRDAPQAQQYRYFVVYNLQRIWVRLLFSDVLLDLSTMVILFATPPTNCTLIIIFHFYKAIICLHSDWIIRF